MDYCCDLCDRTIKLISKGKLLQSPTHNDQEILYKQDKLSKS